MSQAFFEWKGFAVFAHTYFRRSMYLLNTFNQEFLTCFYEISQSNPNAIAKIAIDHNIVGLTSNLSHELEFQYWWAPKFADDIKSTEDGATEHISEDNDIYFFGIEKVQFWWYTQKGNKTFECEELLHLDFPSLSLNENTYGCRFIHSILDPTSNLPVEQAFFCKLTKSSW